MKIGFIGGGIMGLPMAKNLSKAGFDVTLYNRTYSKIEPYKDEMKITDNIKDVIESKDIIFTIVGYPSDVLELYKTIMPLCKKDAILVDMTTSSPKLAKELYEEGKKMGLHLLDAPVTGGDLGAIKGTLSIMVGGDFETYTKVVPFFEVMGRTITYMGASGNGQMMKLTNQIAIAANIVGIAESLTFAKDNSLDLDKALAVITGGSANSWQGANNGPKMIIKDYKPGFFIKHFIKDLRLALDEMKTDLPILKYAEGLYTRLNQLELGTQAIIESYINK